METQKTPQPCGEVPQPQKEHRWLQRLAGEWTFEAEARMGPDAPVETFGGTETVRPVGELWIQAEGRGDTPEGIPVTSLLTLGYDPRRRRFVGTFLASVMTHLWVYDGTLDAAERVLTLDTEGPDMSDESKTARYQEAIELQSDDHRVFTSRVLGADGTWREVMRAHYRRRR
ncbi:MAG: DUF1579 domain-containing protein [Thermodesulfobacteriota bacterium]